MSFFNHRNKIVKKADARSVSGPALLASSKKLVKLTKLNGSSKKGFSLVELLIVIVIVGVLGVISFIAIQRTKTRALNERMLDDLVAIANSLEDYRRDHQGAFPEPTTATNQNVLCFYKDATYADCDNTDGGVAFRQGMIDNDLLTKRYLREVPTDPRTGSRYVYGVSIDKKFYQVAGIWENDDGKFEARTVENLAKGFELPSLIRAYDGPNFVVDREANLPYPSDRLMLTGTLENVNGGVFHDSAKTKQAQSGDIVMENDTIYSGGDGSADLYFSDGSVTHLDANGELQMKSLKTEKNDSSGTVTKILLKLNLGKIWNKVARLASTSEFRVETTSAIAGVRGTEFGIESNDTIKVKKGKVYQIPLTGVPSLPTDKHSPEYADKLLSVTIDSGAPMTLATSTDAVYLTDLTENYGLVSLTNNLRPHILSIDTSGTVTIRNVNWYVNKVGVASGVSDRHVAVTRFRIFNSDPNSSGPSHNILATDTTNPYTFGLKELTGSGPWALRFEYRDPAGILPDVQSGSTPLPVPQTGQAMDEKAIYPNLIPLETGFSLNAPDRAPFAETAGGTQTFSVSITGCPDGASYILSATGTPTDICTQNITGTCTADPFTKIVAPITKTITMGRVGTCSVTASATLPNGKTVTDSKPVKVESAYAQLTVGDPIMKQEAGGQWSVSIPWNKGNSTAPMSLSVNGPAPYPCTISSVTANPLVLPSGDCKSLSSGTSDVTYTAIFKLGSEPDIQTTFIIPRVGTAANADFSYTPTPNTSGVVEISGRDVTLDFSTSQTPQTGLYTYQWKGAAQQDGNDPRLAKLDLTGIAAGSSLSKTVTLTVRKKTEGDNLGNIVAEQTKTVNVKRKAEITGIGFAAALPSPSVTAGQSTSFALPDLKITTANPSTVVGQTLTPECNVATGNGNLTYIAGTGYDYSAPGITGTYTVSCGVKHDSIPDGYTLVAPANQPISFTIAVVAPVASMTLAAPKTYYEVNSEIELTLTNLTAAQITVTPTGKGNVTTSGTTGKTVFNPTATGNFTLTATGVTAIPLSVCEYVGDGSKCLKTDQFACYGPDGEPGGNDNTGVWNTDTNHCDICGNGIVEGAEQCDNGLHCADGTPCGSPTDTCSDSSTCSLKDIAGCSTTCNIDPDWSCSLVTNTAPKTGHHSGCVQLCGNGVIDTTSNPTYTETCDNGKQCSNGKQCADDSSCTLVGDGKCLPRSGDGCSDTCQQVSDPGFTCYANPNPSNTPLIPATLCEPSLLVNCVGQAGVRSDVGTTGNITGYKNAGKNSFYQISGGGTCWVMGTPGSTSPNQGQSCDIACNLLMDKNPTADPSSCAPISDNWNDVGGVACNAITGYSYKTNSSYGYAPYIYYSKCYDRIGNYSYTGSDSLCNMRPDLDKQRICKCR